MKTSFFSFPLIFIVFLTFSLITTSSCTKEEEDPYLIALDQIEGEWDVFSYIPRVEEGEEEEEEMWRFIFLKMEYDKYESDKGNFRWTYQRHQQNSSPQTIEGTYQMNPEGNSITLSYDFEFISDSVFNFRIVGNKIKMAGFRQQSHFTLIAEK